MEMKLLRAVCARAGNSRGVTGPLGPALHGEGGLPLAVNIRVGGVVLSRSGAHGEIFGGRADLPPAGEAVAGTGGFVGNLAAQQVGKTVAGGVRKAGSVGKFDL